MTGGTAGMLGPRWLEEARPGAGAEPAGPASVPQLTRLGNVAEAFRPVVDGAGLVAVSGAWSLDWWVGSEERWHHPSREPGLGQRLVGSAPVVETSVRAPGGEVLHRAFAARTAEGAASVLVVEIENATPVAVAVAVAVRPFGAAGPGSVGRIELSGRSVTVDGQPGPVFPRVPAASLWGPDGVDVAGSLPDLAVGVASPTTAAADGYVSSAVGLATAAFVFPLPHGAILRYVVPGGAPLAEVPTGLPDATALAKGWEAHGGRGIRFEIPDPALQHATDAARRQVLLADTGSGLVADDHLTWSDGGEIVLALTRLGYLDEAARALRTLPEAMDRRGGLGGPTRRLDANGVAMVAFGEYVRLSGDDDLAAGLVEVLGGFGRWLRRQQRRSARRFGRADLRSSFVVDGTSPPWLDAGDAPAFWDQLWTLRGLAELEQLLAVARQPRAAADAGHDRARLAEVLATVADGSATAEGVLPSRVGGTPGYDLVAGLVQPSLFATPLPWIRPTLDRAISACGDGLVDTGDGGRPWLTLVLAGAELAERRASVMTRLAAVTDAASPTVSWPERTGPGGSGRPADLRVAARFVTSVRRLLFEDVTGELRLCPLWPEAWLGQGVEVHDAPTRHGLLSFAIRWHGDRPALLWQLEARDGVSPPRITVPGLDDGWSTDDGRGEALLAPVPVPKARRVGTGRPRSQPGAADAGPAVGEGESFT